MDGEFPIVEGLIFKKILLIKFIEHWISSVGRNNRPHRMPQAPRNRATPWPFCIPPGIDALALAGDIKSIGGIAVNGGICVVGRDWLGIDVVIRPSFRNPHVKAALRLGFRPASLPRFAC